MRKFLVPVAFAVASVGAVSTASAAQPRIQPTVAIPCSITKMGTGTTPGTGQVGQFADCFNKKGKLVVRIWNPTGNCKVGSPVSVIDYIPYCSKRTDRRV